MTRQEMEPEKICGDCELFDIRNCNGRLVGNTNLKEGFVRNGYCRGEKGLVLGILNNKSVCKQPLGVFRSKNI